MTDTVILSNQVLCKLCGDTPYSRNRHDMRYCKCENVAVDGGCEYLKRTYATDQWVDISIEWPREYFIKIYSELGMLREVLEADREEIIFKLVDLYIDLRNLDKDTAPVYCKAVKWALETGRNMHGILYALARTERDGDFYVTD